MLDNFAAVLPAVDWQHNTRQIRVPSHPLAASCCCCGNTSCAAVPQADFQLDNMKSDDVAKYLPRKLNCIANEMLLKKRNSSLTDYKRPSRPMQKSLTSVMVDPPSPSELIRSSKHLMSIPLQTTTLPTIATCSNSKESIVSVPSNKGKKEGCALSARARSVSSFGKDPIASCEKPEALFSKSCRDVDFVDTKMEKKHDKSRRQIVVRCRPMSPHPADVISSQKQAAIRAKKGDPEKQRGQVLLANSALESTVAEELRQLIEAMQMEVSNPVYQIVMIILLFAASYYSSSQYLQTLGLVSTPALQEGTS